MDPNKYKIVSIGNYYLTGKTIGRGNYSSVREAIDKSNNQKVAVKIINLANTKDTYVKRHYKREAYLLSKIQHPNIVKMFDFVELRDRFVIVLEVMPENLCDFVRDQRRGKLEESTARIIFRQITSGIAYLHANGIIHRDIKLENILLHSKRMIVKLADFGLSNELDKKSMLMTKCGSAEYSSPELHEGKKYGNEVDIWALGVVLFGMVVGRLPFEVEKKKPVSNQHRRELFLEETKRGIKTMKHQTHMSSTSYLYRDLTSKMLNPDQFKRIKIDEVEKHHWLVFQKIKMSAESTYSTNNRTKVTSSNEVSEVNRPRTAANTGCSSIMPDKKLCRPITQAENYRSLSIKQYVKDIANRSKKYW